jgi:antitoxin YefM
VHGGSVLVNTVSRITAPRGTIVAMTTEPLRNVRDHLSDFVDRAATHHERVVVTRNGRPAAVLIGYDDLESLEESLDILSDPEARSEIQDGLSALAEGDYIEGTQAVRALRPKPQ